MERVALDGPGEAQREPLASPDAEGAIWASLGPDRLVYGLPGSAPYLALSCAGEGAQPRLEITRYAATDRRAKALMALVGNGHIARLKVDAEWNGKAWIWQGAVAPDHPQIAVLTGPRDVEATIPGAGTLKLNASPLPRELVQHCRELAAPAEEPAEPSAPA